MLFDVCAIMCSMCSNPLPCRVRITAESCSSRQSSTLAQSSCQLAMPLPPAVGESVEGQSAVNWGSLVVNHGEGTIPDGARRMLVNLSVEQLTELLNRQLAEIRANAVENSCMQCHLNLIQGTIAAKMVLANQVEEGGNLQVGGESAGESVPAAVANPEVNREAPSDQSSSTRAPVAISEPIPAASTTGNSPPISTTPTTPTIASTSASNKLPRTPSPTAPITVTTIGQSTGASSRSGPTVPIERCQYVDRRIAAQSRGESSRDRIRAMLPPVQVHPDQSGPANRSTVFVRNLPFGVCEEDIIIWFNSVGGEFANRCTALSAINIIYHRNSNGENRMSGSAYFLYANQDLANFAVASLDGRSFRGRELAVQISDRRLDCKYSGSANLMVGQSRWGRDIWRCPP